MSLNRLAPEWERQDAIIIVWPHSFSDWASNLEPVETTYTDICKHICQHQTIIIVAYNKEHQHHIEQRLESSSIVGENIAFITIPTNDTWVRDYGPICVAAGQGKTILDFEFDAWGEKYAYDLDNAFTTKLLEQLKLDIPRQAIELVIEAGNLEVNNRGALLCSSTCFQRKSYGTAIDLAYLEKRFYDCFGCNSIHWIHDVKLVGDDTDGHIDTLARFCADDIIIYTSTNNYQDPNNEALHQLAIQLQSLQKQNHNSIELVPLPLPEPIFSANQQLPASYTNFLITNESVLVPIFKDQQDATVLKLMEELFPTRKIIGVNSNVLIQQFGGIHCATIQIPKGILQ